MKKLILLTAIIATAAIATAQWPTFHGNNQRTGFTPAEGPVNPSILWTYDLNGPMINSPAVGPDGTIYTGSVWDEDPQPSAYIYAINPNGTLKWRFETGFYDDQSFSSPAIGPEGNVYVGIPQRAFVAISPTGTELWRHPTLDIVTTNPLVAPNGTVYAKLDGFLFAFSPTGQVLWQFPIGSNTPSSPVLGLDGTIYVAGAGGLFAVNPNGTQKWLFSSADTHATPAVAADGKIIYPTGTLYAVSPAGGMVWMAHYGTAPYSGPTIDAQGNIYTIEDWEFRKFSPTGQLLWEREFIYQTNRLEMAWNAPIVDSANRLYFGLGTGKRWALESAKGIVAYDANGTKLYNFLLPETPSTSSPAMGADGTIYVGCLDGKLYAIGQTWMAVQPASFNISTGTLVSGGLPELLNSDNQALVVRPGATLTTQQKPLVIQLEATLPSGTVNGLRFTLEARTSSASIRQWVEVFNFNTQSWVQLDTRMTTLTDSVTAVTIPNPSQFFEAGTRRVRARVSYKADGPVLAYPWNARIDQAVWGMR